jgi:tetratricopeptide (TPR) repeat protein
VPLRLRGLFVLLLGALGAAPVVAWAFSQHALSADNVSLEARAHAGHRLGLLLLVVCLLVLAAGLAVRFASASRPPSQLIRYRAGVAVLVALALVPVAGAIGLAFSSRGLGGSISHAWRSLTDPHATTPPNDPSRLTAIGSVRARYWNDALKIFKDHPFLGVGAGGYPTARAHYRSDTLEVQHAHGYVVQTLGDLGLFGLVLSLLAAAAWIVAALRAASPFGWRARAPGLPYTPERIGLLTLITCVVVFTVHSVVDWTWFVPGNACVALLCAGWVAGRGPHTERLRSEWPALATLQRSPLRSAAAAATLATALLIAWSQWQPLRSQHAADAALAALGRHDYATARSKANAAANRNPLSVEPLFDLAAIENDAGRRDAARAALQRAVRLQPSNARAWERLAEFDQNQLGDRNQALRDLGPALYLDPQSHAGINQFLDTLRGGQAVSGTTAVTP